MTELRDGIGLRAYGQRDPVIEYKREGYEMFEELSLIHIFLPVGELRLYAGLDQGAQQEISARIPPFSKHTFRCRIPCSHRGIYASGVGRVAACDLFGLFQMRRTLNARQIGRAHV